MRLSDMLLRGLVAALATSSIATAAVCSNCTNESTEPYVLAPAPWTLPADIYTFFLAPGLGISLDNSLPAKAYSPLERSDPKTTEGKFVGGLGLIQINRYYDGPAGAYDELFFVPGFFQYERDGEQKKGIRVSRIYVSQKYCVWNARLLWNIPKHLAKFDWTDHADGSTSVKIYTYDTSSFPSNESAPGSDPFFQMTFSNLLPLLPLPPPLSDLNPRIPFSTDLYTLLGINVTLIQPQLPAGNDTYGAIVSGGPVWKAVFPEQSSTHTTIGTFDLSQSGGEGEKEGTNAVGDEYYPNFWPGVLRTTVGLKMKNATVTFGVPEVWDAED